MTYTTEDQAHEMETLANDSTSPKREASITDVTNDVKSIDMDTVDSRKLKAISCETMFYDTLFSIISPFVYLGMPYNYCFPNRYKTCYRIHGSWVAKVSFIFEWFSCLI